MMSVTRVVRNGLEVADQQAVDAADDRADGKRCRHGGPGRKLEDVEEVERGEIAGREDRADAEVDAAADQGEGHGERDEAELGIEPHQRQQVLQPGIVWNRRREPRQQDDHHGEGDHRLEPLLQQQLRQQEPRRQAGAQPHPEAVVRAGDRHRLAPVGRAAARSIPVQEAALFLVG
jgi:hypothetical protein